MNAQEQLEAEKEQRLAEALHLRLKQLAALDNTQLVIPVLTEDRSCPRKEIAAMVRKLLKELELKGVSVTAPVYSMASCVHIKLPHRRDYTPTARNEIDWANDPAAVANREAEKSLMAILAIAFPNHDDRSERGTDYYDSKWSVS